MGSETGLCPDSLIEKDEGEMNGLCAVRPSRIALAYSPRACFKAVGT